MYVFNNKEIILKKVKYYMMILLDSNVLRYIFDKNELKVLLNYFFKEMKEIVYI